MKITDVKDILFITSTIFGVVVIVTYFLINMGRNVIKRGLGIKKIDKGSAILEMVTKIIYYIFGAMLAVGVILFELYKNTNSDTTHLADNSNFKVMLLFIINIVVLVCCNYRVIKIKNTIDKYIENYDYNESLNVPGTEKIIKKFIKQKSVRISNLINKRRVFISVLVDCVCAYLGVKIIYDSKFGIESIVIYIYYLVLIYVSTVVWVGYEKTLKDILDLKEFDISYENHNKIKKVCAKIVYTDEMYTTMIFKVLNKTKIQHLNNKNIISIKSR